MGNLHAQAEDEEDEAEEAVRDELDHETDDNSLYSCAKVE